jgi:hypothetical protein
LSFCGFGVGFGDGVVVVGVALGDELTLGDGLALGDSDTCTPGACAPVSLGSLDLHPEVRVSDAATAIASVKAFRTMRFSCPTRGSLPKSVHDDQQSADESGSRCMVTHRCKRSHSPTGGHGETFSAMILWWDGRNAWCGRL